MSSNMEKYQDALGSALVVTLVVAAVTANVLNWLVFGLHAGFFAMWTLGTIVAVGVVALLITLWVDVYKKALRRFES